MASLPIIKRDHRTIELGDHTHITGIGDGPMDAAVVFQVNPKGLICKVWFFAPD